LSVVNGQVGQSDPFTPSPAADADTTSMLGWGVWRPTSSAGAGFTLNQTLANGTYQLYFWEAEDFQSNYRSFDIRLQGVTAASGLGDQARGQWKKYGPYLANVTNGVLQIDVVRGAKGDPQLMGLAIFTGTPVPTYSMSGTV